MFLTGDPEGDPFDKDDVAGFVRPEISFSDHGGFMRNLAAKIRLFKHMFQW
jgi:hypothetical protein